MIFRDSVCPLPILVVPTNTYKVALLKDEGSADDNIHSYIIIVETIIKTRTNTATHTQVVV